MMKKNAAAILRRWRARLAVRRALLTRAGKAHDACPNDHAAKALLITRKEQVRYAERVVKRYKRTNLPLRLKALAHAEAALARHVFETGGNNRGPEVERIIHYAGGDVGEPWCVDFDVWCYGHAGSKAMPGGGSFPRAVRLMGGRYGITVKGARAGLPGDPVRFKFDHTGMLVYYCDSKGRRVSARVATHIKTIEGNTGAAGAVSDGNGSDGVYKKIRSLDLVADTLEVTS